MTSVLSIYISNPDIYYSAIFLIVVSMISRVVSNYPINNIYKLSLIALLLIIQFNSFGQWQQYKTLKGGSVGVGLVSYNGMLFISTLGSGNFKSTDGGASWIPVPIDARQFVVHKGNLYGVGGTGTYYTSDGNNWASKVGINNNDNVFQTYTNDNRIIAAGFWGLYFSDDDADTWTKFSTPPNTICFNTLAVEGSNIVSSSAYEFDKIHLSRNGGTTWDPVSTPGGPVIQLAYHGTLLFMSIGGKGLFKSIDNGAHWQQIRIDDKFYGRFLITQNKIFIASRGQLAVSTDQGTTWSESAVAPSRYASTKTLLIADNMLYMGTEGAGMFRTYVETPYVWDEINDGLNLFSISDIAATSNTIFVGTAEAAIQKSSDGGNTWDSYGNPAEMRAVHGLDVSGSTIFSAAARIFKSSNDGQSWQNTGGVINGFIVTDVATRYNEVFAVTSDGIYHSLDGGENWTKYSDGITGSIWSVKVFGNDVYADLGSGLWHLNDAAHRWEKIPIDRPQSYIAGFAKLGSALIVTTQEGVLETRDHGQNWSVLNALQGTKLFLRYNELYMSGQDPNTWEHQFHQSLDSGKTWVNITGELPPDGIMSAATFTKDKIIVGYGGKGIWHRELTEIALPRFSIANLAPDSTFFAGHSISIEVDQNLYKINGDPIADEDLSNIITVYNKDGIEVPFKANVYSTGPGFYVTIENNQPGEEYKIVITPLENKSGLQTAQQTFRIAIVANKPPTVAGITTSIVEGTQAAYTSALFETVYSDAEGQDLTGIQITQLPTHGLLRLGDNVLTSGGHLGTFHISQLVYTPFHNFAGRDSWKFKGFDGYDYSTEEAVVAIEVIPAYPPVVDDITIQVTENSSEQFDPILLVKTYGADLLSVRVIELPSHGTLKRNNVNIVVNEEMLIGELNTVSYSPDVNYTGTDIWKLTAYDGYQYSSPVNVNIEVTPVTGIHESVWPKINVYPNPVKDKITIEGNIGAENLNDIRLVESTGKTLTVHPIVKGERIITIDLSGAIPGVYFLKIEAGKKTRVIKIVKD
jgi:photosystem II stability/assembly factor-like uncharacterized protein